MSDTALYWFRQDLRLHDNPGLMSLQAGTRRLALLYIIDPADLRQTVFQSRSLGLARWDFLLQSLRDLDMRLRDLGQHLHVAFGDPVDVIRHCVNAFGVQRIATVEHPGVYERRQVRTLREVLGPRIPVTTSEHFTLWSQSRLPFRLDAMPDQFTPFRHRMELRAPPAEAGERVITMALPVTEPDLPLPPPRELPPPPTGWPGWDTLPAHPDSEAVPGSGIPVPRIEGFEGGERAGLDRLQHFVSIEGGITRYKLTRDAPDDPSASSRLSPWLALGALSPRSVWHAVRAFEHEVLANESTYWLRFELLWREFFQWHLRKHGSRLFHPRGVRDRNPLLSFYPGEYMAWRSGHSGQPVVDACLRQLNQTGFLSNRGRQWAASYLVNELGLDWRYGAAWFEQQLVDFDVASNWGNWQYLAGVGADPRGRRHFNLEEQIRRYDPEGCFVARWHPPAVLV